MTQGLSRQTRQYEIAWLREVRGSAIYRMAVRCGSAKALEDTRAHQRRAAALQRIKQS